MDEEREKRRDFFPLKIRNIFGRDLCIFLIFLLVAFVLWYLNSLRKETETTLRLQLEYVNLPSGMLVANNSSSAVYLNISGQGYSLLKFSMNKKNRQLKVDLSMVKPVRKPAVNSGNEYYLITGPVLKEYMKHISSAEIKVLSVKPDTLYIFLEKNPSEGKTE